MDFNVIGPFIAICTGIASFVIGRKLRKKWAAKRREKERQASQANETRQVRRARERRERGE
jgi:hypothetical protein